MASAVENTTLNSGHPGHFISYQPKKRLDRWHVCSDFQNGTCHKPENECEYAHPSAEKEIIQGIVTICMDHVNDQCLRSTCKYLHPPKHICAQIHDHKKRPYPGFKSQLHSPTDIDRPEFVSNQEDCFSPQYPFPYHYFLPNPSHNHLYMSHYLSNQINLQGQGYPNTTNFQNQISTGLQVRGRTEYAQRSPKRSISVSDVPSFRSSNLSPDNVHLNTPPSYTPALYPSAKFLSSFSSSPNLHSAPFQQAGPSTLAAIPTTTDTTDVATATPQIDSQTISSMSYTEDTD